MSHKMSPLRGYQRCKRRQIWQIYLCYHFQGVVIIYNVTKFLLIFILQKISLIQCYLDTKSIHHLAIWSLWSNEHFQWVMYMGKRSLSCQYCYECQEHKGSCEHYDVLPNKSVSIMTVLWKLIWCYFGAKFASVLFKLIFASLWGTPLNHSVPQPLSEFFFGLSYKYVYRPDSPDRPTQIPTYLVPYMLMYLKVLWDGPSCIQVFLMRKCAHWTMVW